MSSLRLALKMSMGDLSHQGDDAAPKKAGARDGTAKLDGNNNSSSSGNSTSNNSNSNNSNSNNGNGPPLKRRRSESEVSTSSAGGKGSVKGDRDSDIEESSDHSLKVPAKKSKDNKIRSMSNLSSEIVSRSNSIVEEKDATPDIVESETTVLGTPSKSVPKGPTSVTIKSASGDAAKSVGSSQADATATKKASNSKSKEKQFTTKDEGKVAGSSSNKTAVSDSQEESLVPRPTKSIKTATSTATTKLENNVEKDESNTSEIPMSCVNEGHIDMICADADNNPSEICPREVDGFGDDESNTKNDHTNKNQISSETSFVEGNIDSVEEVAPEGESPRYQSHRAAAMVAKDRLAAKPTRTITATDGGPGDPSSSSYRAPEQRKSSSSSGGNSNKSGPVEEAKWVQCEQCTKWRLLPQHVDLDLLPEQWYCIMNEWDSLRNNCDAPEATAETADMPKEARDSTIETQQPTRSANVSRSSGSSKSNHRRSDDNDASKSVSSHRSSSGTNKTVDPVNWVQCNKCSKWRKVPGSIDVNSLPEKWFCSLNTWAPYYARCSAKEETDDPVDNRMDDDRPGGNRSGSHSAKKGGNLSHSNSHGSSNTLAGATAVKKVTQWVQCERRNCKKWRKVPALMDMAKFPEKWFCEMNTWDPDRAGCDNGEETDSETEQQSGVSPSRSQLILANSKGPGALSYRRIIFGTDGRIRPCYNEKNKSGFGLFSFTESNRNSNSNSSSGTSNEDRNNDYIEPSRRVAYWWSSAYDEKSGTRFKSISSSHPSANTPRGKEANPNPNPNLKVKEEPAPASAPSPTVPEPAAAVPVVEDAKDAAEAPSAPVVSPRPRDRDRGMSKELALLLGDEREREEKHSTPKKPRESRAKEKEEEETVVPIIEVPIAALEVEQSTYLVDTIRRINNLSVASKLKSGAPKMRQKIWNQYASLPLFQKFKIECNVIRCCLLSSPSCSMSLPVLVGTLQSMTFISHDEEICRRCMCLDAIMAAVRRLEMLGEADVYMGLGSEPIVVGFPPVSSQTDRMLKSMDRRWDGKGLPLKMRKAYSAISATRTANEEEEKAKRRKKGSLSSSSSSSLRNKNSNTNSANSDNEEEDGATDRGADDGDVDAGEIGAGCTLARPGQGSSGAADAAEILVKAEIGDDETADHLHEASDEMEVTN